MTRTSSTDAPPAAGASPLAAIELIGVAKEFGGHDDNVNAVEDVNLSIASGEFFSLLGPSGCGKTTTLRMIAGFEEPTRGRILLYGEDMVGVPPNRRDVNLVFQSYALFPHMSVYDNVAFGLRRKGMTKSEIDTRVRKILELVELEGRQRRRPKELSGGQQQRVALARALVNEPRALLLDEPLGALDLKLRQAMQIELKRIQREVGITFVYVTHDQSEALTMSDHIAVMNHGRVEQLGTPREIYAQPATRFVAGFIGTSNILEATVARVTDDTVVLDAREGERLFLAKARPFNIGERVDLTVRPEKIGLSGEAPGEGLCALRGRVAEVIYLGTSTNFTVTTQRGTEMVVYRQNSATDETAVERGDDVWLSWQPEHSYALEHAL